MTIEEEIFARSAPNVAAFVPFGFVCGRDGCYRYSEKFLDNQFRADVCIKDGVITGCVFDMASGEEYLPLRVKCHQGVFVNEVRASYSAVLHRIKDSCFMQLPFLSVQANRIAIAVRDMYGDMPDFAFPTAPTYAVFRNPKNKKWYGIVMNVARSKLTTKHVAKESRSSEQQAESEKTVEILNVKLTPEKSAQFIAKRGFFLPYHMNKKNWITVLLDGTVRDSVIMELIAESHAFTENAAVHPSHKTRRKIDAQRTSSS